MIHNREKKFFTSFSAQRRELRKIWNDLDNDKNIYLDWDVFLSESELKVLKISDTLAITLEDISITYDIITLLKMYENLSMFKKRGLKMKTNIIFLRQNAVNDIFQYTDENGKIDFISFPRTMEMTKEDVEQYLN